MPAVLVVLLAPVKPEEDSVRVKIQKPQLRHRNRSKQKRRRSTTEERSTSIILIIGIRIIGVISIGVHLPLIHAGVGDSHLKIQQILILMSIHRYVAKHLLDFRLSVVLFVHQGKDLTPMAPKRHHTLICITCSYWVVANPKAEVLSRTTVGTWHGHA